VLTPNQQKHAKKPRLKRVRAPPWTRREVRTPIPLYKAITN